jgi:hypothetical protein
MRVRFRSRLVALDTKGSNGAHGGSRERIVTVRRFAVESGLFEPQSPLPGNGILRPETKRPKRLRRFKDAVAETKSR